MSSPKNPTFKPIETDTRKALEEFFEKSPEYNFQGHFNFVPVMSIYLNHLFEIWNPIIHERVLTPKNMIDTGRQYTRAFEIISDDSRYVVIADFEKPYEESKKFKEMLDEKIKSDTSTRQSDMPEDIYLHLMGINLEFKLSDDPNVETTLGDLPPFSPDAEMKNLTILHIPLSEDMEKHVEEILSHKYSIYKIAKFSPTFDYSDGTTNTSSANSFQDLFSVMNFISSIQETLSEKEREILKKKVKLEGNRNYIYFDVAPDSRAESLFGSSLPFNDDGLVGNETKRYLKEFIERGMSRTFSNEIKNLRKLDELTAKWKAEHGNEAFDFNDLDNEITRTDVENGIVYDIKDQNGDFTITHKTDENMEFIEIRENRTNQTLASFKISGDMVTSIDMPTLDMSRIRSLNTAMFDIGSAMACLEEDMDSSNSPSP